MNLLLDSFWRAVAYCIRPGVIALSFLPLILMVACGYGAWYFYWDEAVQWVRVLLDAWPIIGTALEWLEGVGLSGVRSAFAPFTVIVLAAPVIVMLSLLVVALLMTPTLVSLVAERRFATLERKRGGSMLMSVVWSLGSTVVAMIAMIVSIPLWLLPPLILVLPPLIWGWLTYRVMTFDALSAHASTAERRELMRKHRGWLFGMGVLTGYLGVAPSLVWASGVLFAAAFVVLIPVAIWIYTLVFAFSSLWFSHYCLAALQALRAESQASVVVPKGEPIEASVVVLPDHSTNKTEPDDRF